MLNNPVAKLVLGLVIGSVFGILPGFYPTVLQINDPLLNIFVFSSFLFFSLIPSTLFLMPNENYAFTLPKIKKVAMKKEETDLLFVMAVSLFLGFLLGLFFSFVFLSFLHNISFSKEIVFFVMLVVVLKELSKGGMYLLVYLLSGALGIVSLDLIEDAVPLSFLGFFGISQLLVLFLEDEKKEKGEKKERIKDMNIKAIIVGAFFGGLFAYFPTLSPGRVSALVGLEDPLFSIPSLSGGMLGGSIVFYLFSSKKRNAFLYLLNNLNPFYSIGIFLISVSFSFVLFLLLFKHLLFLKKYQKVLSLFSFILMFFFFHLSFNSFVLLLASTSLGLFASLKAVDKTALLGFLTFPTLFIYGCLLL